MDIKQIKSMGKELNKFLAKFDDCFSRSESRQNLRTYIKGQLSDLPRKSIEPIALAANVKSRTLQNFLSAIPWDQQHLLDKLQWMVAKDHAHPDAVGIIDESGNPNRRRKKTLRRLRKLGIKISQLKFCVPHNL